MWIWMMRSLGPGVGVSTVSRDKLYLYGVSQLIDFFFVIHWFHSSAIQV